MSKAQEKREKQAESLEHLRSILQPGDTVYTVLRHVSRSGMFRLIDVYAIKDGEPLWLTGYVANVLGDIYPRDSKRDALRVSGCGMDMGFAVAHNLSSVLYPDGFMCIGKRKDDYSHSCPSNDHSNGDRDYTPHMHASGGYALRHKWM